MTTPRPNAQDIREARNRFREGFRARHRPSTPEKLRETADRLERLEGVFDFAEQCRAAEEEGERVPDATAEGVVELMWDDRGEELRDSVGNGYGYTNSDGDWAYYEDGGYNLIATGTGPTQVAARIEVEKRLPPRCRVTNPETPAEPEQQPEPEPAREVLWWVGNSLVDADNRLYAHTPTGDNARVFKHPPLPPSGGVYSLIRTDTMEEARRVSEATIEAHWPGRFRFEGER